MASERGLYWLAVGVFALGIGNSLAKGPAEWACRLADRSVAMAEQVSARAVSYVAMAESLINRGDATYGRTEQAVLHAQIRLAHAQSQIAHHQAEMARVRAEKVRVLVLDRVNRRIPCPEQKIVVEVPDPPAVSDNDTI